MYICMYLYIYKKTKKNIYTHVLTLLFTKKMQPQKRILKWRARKNVVCCTNIPGREKFSPGELTLGEILPGKNSVPELKHWGKNSVPPRVGRVVKRILTRNFFFSRWQDEIGLSLKTAGKFLSQGLVKILFWNFGQNFSQR